MTISAATKRREVIVIGGGQAGLAMGYFLAQQGRDFLILEAAQEPGAAWRGRWDSLKLFTSVRYSSLPGLPFPGDPDSYPTRDQVVEYLTAYARHFDLPVEPGSPVRSVSRKSEAGYLVALDDRTYEADQVVVATGPFHAPRTPPIAEALAPHVVQLHSSEYRSPADVPSGRVLVVGGGNTGFQIAEELAASRELHLSIGSRQAPLPQRLLGRDLFWYLDATGLIRTPKGSWIGRRAEGRDTLIGSSPRAMRRRGVELHPRTVNAAGAAVTFEDGTTLEVDAVLWATGFGIDHSFVDVPVFDDRGHLVHQRGVTESPGLYFLGLSWQHTRGSALIGWVKDDAEFLAQQIGSYQRSAPSLTATTSR
jgi:putative flavoprotein involved in K+ transport